LAHDEKLAERVRQILASRRGVAEKKLMGTLAFMVQGALCCSVARDGLLVRIKAEERAALLTESSVFPVKLGARTMKGFIRVAPAGLRTRANLMRWLERGIAAGSKARSVSSRGGRQRPK
jgi:TfoX/Sxy family transcriptional regulator of competence genes